jgi:hypothetical protein
MTTATADAPKNAYRSKLLDSAHSYGRSGHSILQAMVYLTLVFDSNLILANMDSIERYYGHGRDDMNRARANGRA